MKITKKEFLSIIIPVYNEDQTILKIISILTSLQLPIAYELIFVNDGSTDHTGQMLSNLKEKNIRVISYAHNKGKGYALRQGFAKARGTMVLTQDADLEYDPMDIPKLLRPILEGKTNVVYGSRFMNPDHHPRYHLFYFGNRLLSILTSMLFGQKISDMETGYKLISTDILQTLQLTANGFAIEPEMTVALIKQGYHIHEVPITYHGRSYEAGKKIIWKDGVYAILFLLQKGVFDYQVRLAHWVSAHHKLFLGMILIMGFLARLHLVRIIPPLGGSDELKHIITAKFIAENGFTAPPESPVYYQNDWSMLTATVSQYSRDSYAHSVYAKVPAAYHVFLSGFFKFFSALSLPFDDIALRLRVIQTIIGLGGIFCFYLLVRGIPAVAESALLSTYMYATIPLLLFLDATVNWDSAMAAMGSLTALVVYTAIHKPSSTKTILAAVLSSVLFFIKPTAVFFMGTLIAWGLLQQTIRRRIFSMIIIFCILILPYGFHNIRTYGTPLPDPQKQLFLTSIHAPWIRKTFGMVQLYSQHRSFLYPQNRNTAPGLIEPILKILVYVSMAGISLLVLYALAGIIRGQNTTLLFFAIAPVAYIIGYTILQWSYVPGLADIPDRSARSFSSLFFSIPILIVYGLQEISKRNRIIKKSGKGVIFLIWNLLVLQTLFL